jgi:Zn-finger nucleic acid-binding protein
MKCISCEVEINPKWAHAVEINVCPFCGKHIMEEHLKNLFTSLRETMSQLQTYPDQLNDWMLSNHNYIKTDSNQIGLYMPKEMLKDLKKLDDDKEFQKRKEAQKYTVKVQTETGEEEVVAEKIQSEETTNDFFKRAEVIKPLGNNNPSPNGPRTYQSPESKTQHLKKVAQQIKRAGSQGLVSDGTGGMLPAHMLEQADPEAVAEFQSMISSGEVVSSLPNASDGDGDDDVPAFILAANQAAAAGRVPGSGGEANAKDIAHLQRLQSKVSQAQKNMTSGSKGSFSRS